jgi:hypothetical protein
VSGYPDELLDQITAAMHRYFLAAETEDAMALRTRVIYRIRERFNPTVIVLESVDFEEATLAWNRLTAASVIDAYREETEDDPAPPAR